MPGYAQRFKRSLQTGVHACWEVAAAFGVFLASYLVVLAVLMALVGGPTPLAPGSVAMFARQWRAETIPSGVQTVLFIAAVFLPFGVGGCVLARRKFLPAAWGITDGDRRAAFLDLAPETRRKMALAELGDIVDVATEEQRIGCFNRLSADRRLPIAFEETLKRAAELSSEERDDLDAQLLVDRDARIAARSRLVDEIAARRSRAIAQIERQSTSGGAADRRVRKDSRKRVGGVELSDEDFAVLQDLRDLAGEGRSIRGRIGEVSQSLREALFASRVKGDEKIVEALENSGAYDASLDEQAVSAIAAYGARGASDGATAEAKEMPAEPQRINDVPKLMAFVDGYDRWMMSKAQPWRSPAIADAFRGLVTARKAVTLDLIARAETLTNREVFLTKWSNFTGIYRDVGELARIVRSLSAAEIILPSHWSRFEAYGEYWMADLAAYAGVGSETGSVEMIRRIEDIDAALMGSLGAEFAA